MPPVTVKEVLNSLPAQSCSLSENEPSAANVNTHHCEPPHPFLQTFSTIYRNSTTGALKCPLEVCKEEFAQMDSLKAHYRTHGGEDYRPFKCIYDPSTCRYGAHNESFIEVHILTVHLASLENPTGRSGDVDWSTFMYTHADLLAKEDALFKNATILDNIPPATLNSLRTDLTSLVRFACPLCSRKFTKMCDFRFHNRTHHQGKTAFRCTFHPGCGHFASTRKSVRGHVLSAHLNVPWRKQKGLSEAEKAAANNYVEMEEEVPQLNTPDDVMAAVALQTLESSTHTTSSTTLSENNELSATIYSKTLPLLPFTTIYRGAISGRFKCPMARVCSKEFDQLAELRTHYRVHGGNSYRPFRCIFDPAICRFAANLESAVEGHIRNVHFSRLPSGVVNYNGRALEWTTFMHTKTDWLHLEEALFSCAQIEQELMPNADDGESDFKFVCPVCYKRLPEMDDLRPHYRTHTKAKPYRCSNCGHTGATKKSVHGHVLAIHFNVPWRKQKDLSGEQKQEANQFVEELLQVLRQEEAELAAAMSQMPKTALVQNNN